jgi:hypothetical protein
MTLRPHTQDIHSPHLAPLQIRRKQLLISEIKDEDIRPEDVPKWEDGWSAINQFALTIDGYAAAGSRNNAGLLCLKDELNSIREARCALFYLARGSRFWTNGEPSESEKFSIIGVLNTIRTFATLKNPPSPGS